VRTRHDPKLERLAEIPLFRGSTTSQLRAVAKLTTEIEAPRGTVLCREGEVGRQCFVIRQGRARVTIGGDEVATIGPGDVLGELSLLDGQPRVATVTAVSEMHLVVLSRTEFHELLAESPAVSRRIIEALGARLRAADMELHSRLSA
jgi:CRP/FNR family cyclic AMP-dependent transcriptional regulator